MQVLLLSPVVIWRSTDGGHSFANNTGLPNAGQGTIVPWDTGNITFTFGLAYTAIEVLPRGPLTWSWTFIFTSPANSS